MVRPGALRGERTCPRVPYLGELEGYAQNIIKESCDREDDTWVMNAVPYLACDACSAQDGEVRTTLSCDQLLSCDGCLAAPARAIATARLQ